MLSSITRTALVLSAGLALPLAGCQQPLRTGDQPHAQADDTGCQLCFDRLVTVSRMHPKGAGHSRRSRIRIHSCPDCEVHRTIMAADDRSTIHCAGCAPDGQPCDKCPMTTAQRPREFVVPLKQG